MTNPIVLLPVVNAAGCACCSTSGTTTDTAPDTATEIATEIKETPMSTMTYPVTGMTCGHCVSAVLTEVKQIPGVTDVSVDLVAGGTSSVTVASQAPLAESDVAAALDEAGDYTLASS